MTLNPNTLISHYKILSEIGKGGMGEVYLAQDTKLERKVAIKLLPAEASRDREKLQRFRQEAKAASALNHPGILTIYEIDEVEGKHYIATEYINGTNIGAYIRERKISLEKALDIAIQIVTALKAAHQSGIVHRDIKPENVMIREDGIIKILDFGLAKLLEQGPAGGEAPKSGPDSETMLASAPGGPKTSPGMVMGTVNYMSPEQARGLEVDQRADIFSFGAVLYEMLTRKRAFDGETTSDAIAAVLTKEPVPVRELNEGVPERLSEIVDRTLRKDKEERFDTSADLLDELTRLRKHLQIEEIEKTILPELEQKETKIFPATTAGAGQETTSGEGKEDSIIIRKSLAGKIAFAALILVAAGIAGYFAWSTYFAGAKGIDSIAVMPFLNESGNEEIEYLSDGMTETLISSLSQIPNLNVKSRSAVFRYKGKQTAAQVIGQELGVQAILNGRVVQRGEQLILSLELIDAATENVIWSDKYERGQAEIVSLQTEIARDVSSKLRSRLSGDEEDRLARNYSKNPEAYELYLKGRFYWNIRRLEDIEKSLEYFKKAAEIDPEYALAYTGISDAFALISVYRGAPPREVMPKAREAAKRALELNPELAEAHTALALVLGTFDYDFAAAEREYKKAIELDPDYATAHQWYAELLYFLGRFEESEKEIKLALEIDPGSPVINRVFGIILLHSRRYDEAEAQARRTIELDRDPSGPFEDLFEIYALKKNYPAAVDSKVRYEQSNGKLERAENLRSAYSVGGWPRFLETLIEFEIKENPFSASKRAVMLGKNDLAFEMLEQTYKEREFAILQIRVDAFLDPIRNDPRYKDLAERVGFPD